MNLDETVPSHYKIGANSGVFKRSSAGGRTGREKLEEETHDNDKKKKLRRTLLKRYPAKTSIRGMLGLAVGGSGGGGNGGP